MGLFALSDRLLKRSEELRLAAGVRQHGSVRHLCRFGITLVKDGVLLAFGAQALPGWSISGYF